jgi:hypothetical protein
MATIVTREVGATAKNSPLTNAELDNNFINLNNAIENLSAPALASTSSAGLMSASDKTKLDGVAAGAQVNTVTSVAGKTGAVTLEKTDVGLSNVDNTSDAGKPVSTAQQTALNLKANLASPALTGVPTAPTAAVGTNTTQLATTAHVFAERAATATLTNKTLTTPVLTGAREVRVAMPAKQ